MWRGGDLHSNVISPQERACIAFALKLTDLAVPSFRLPRDCHSIEHLPGPLSCHCKWQDLNLLLRCGLRILAPAAHLRVPAHHAVERAHRRLKPCSHLQNPHPYPHLCTKDPPRQWTKFHGYSEAQSRTVSSVKYFCDHRFEDTAAPFSATPWVAKRAGKMCGNSHTPVPARPRHFSATPGSLVRCQSPCPHPCAAQPPAIPTRPARDRIAPRSRAPYCIPARRYFSRAAVGHPCRIADT